MIRVERAIQQPYLKIAVKQAIFTDKSYSFFALVKVKKAAEFSMINLIIKIRLRSSQQKPKILNNMIIKTMIQK